MQSLILGIGKMTSQSRKIQLLLKIDVKGQSSSGSKAPSFYFQIIIRTKTMRL